MVNGVKKGYYICMISDSASSGVVKKIAMQVAELQKKFTIELIKVSKIQRGFLKRIWGLFFWTSNQYDYEHLFGQLDNPDFIYMRYPLTDRKQIIFLQRIRETYPRCRIIIEIPTYPYEGEKWRGTNLFFLIKDIYYRKQLKQYVSRFVTYSLDETIWDVPTIRTMNGIDVNSIKTIRPEKHSENEIHMIGVAMLQKHHGFERVIEGIKQYYTAGTGKDLRRIIFHIVGDGPEKKKYEKSVQKYSLTEHVIFHGVLSGENLDKIYNQCDLAVASLGLFKLKLSYISTLKTREYLAKGIPIIYACQDSALNQDDKYCMEVSNDSRPIDIDSVIDFCDRIYDGSYDKKLETIKCIRKYAEKTVSMDKVMQPIIQYIENEIIINENMKR